ncbi:MAG TPA: hypothetical protein VK509_04330, partial [Polyangiales bacterium]|nr:hypothetical protein [Polyangiales bacterium]
ASRSPPAAASPASPGLCAALDSDSGDAEHAAPSASAPQANPHHALNHHDRELRWCMSRAR